MLMNTLMGIVSKSLISLLSVIEVLNGQTNSWATVEGGIITQQESTTWTRGL